MLSVTNETPKKMADRLVALLNNFSKHSLYQELYPALGAALPPTYSPQGKSEHARWEFMKRHSDWRGMEVVDIGANTGYFSMAAIDSYAEAVTAVEGNAEHAEFILQAARLMNLEVQLRVEHRYFDFENDKGKYDLALCLNVLHHLGDDFGDPNLSIQQAKKGITRQLHFLSHRARYCWLQLGFNWKGDPCSPLFADGSKSEMICFIRETCGDSWSIEKTGIYNPTKHAYDIANDDLLARFDNLGEFLNRPLFLLKSLS